jgi:hypothetical protein
MKPMLPANARIGPDALQSFQPSVPVIFYPVAIFCWNICRAAVEDLSLLSSQIFAFPFELQGNCLEKSMRSALSQLLFILFPRKTITKAK